MAAPTAAAPAAPAPLITTDCEKSNYLSLSHVVTESDGAAAVGDLVVIEGAGAYCSSMSTKGYNSFPEAAEVMYDPNGVGHLIRRRQPPEEIWANEVAYKAAAH